MPVKYHKEVVQGSDEWIAMRRGVLTASEMKLIITPTLKIASNEKERTHLFELMAQRITGYVEPHYISDDMLRGQEEEIDAAEAYTKNYSPLEHVGFITNDKFGFTLGYSPDGLIGADGIFECKSRRQKFQIETILSNAIPEEHSIQVQTGLLVSERKWCDFTSYSGGLPMVTIRVEASPIVQEAILRAALEFEQRLKEKMAKYEDLLKSGGRYISTQRKIAQDITV